MEMMAKVQSRRGEGDRGKKAWTTGRRESEPKWRTEAEIQEMIRDKMPDQLKLTFALWTRKAVREVIELRYGFEMPIRTVGEYLKRWGFTPQKPLKRAYEQRPAEVEEWLKEKYPAIERKAKLQGAD